MRVALASCLRIPEPDPDEDLLVGALREADIDARVLAWDDDQAPFAESDLVVVRSTWNYYERASDFVAWAAEVGRRTRLLNPPQVIAWNTRKTYLRDLEDRGVAIVPTAFVTRGLSLGDLCAERGWSDIVIKPVVSAGSYRTARFGAGDLDRAERFLEELTADREAMVQPWMPSVDTYGERSLVWIDGAVTHAIRKSPRFAGGSEQVSEEVPIADDERAFAERALGPLSKELLYARVDMVRDVVRDETSQLRVMELELVEPSLFLRQAPRAAARLALAIAARGKSE